MIKEEAFDKKKELIKKRSHVLKNKIRQIIYVAKYKKLNHVNQKIKHVRPIQKKKAHKTHLDKKTRKTQNKRKNTIKVKPLLCNKK